MALTPSIMKELGTAVPSFSLPNTVGAGKILRLEDVRTPKGLLVMFICNHCPYVKHIFSQLVSIANQALSQGLGVAAISSNDSVSYPEDAPEKMADLGSRLGMKFPYLFDESQAVARAFGAACTPDFFIYDTNLTLAYRGQFDESRPGNGVLVTGKDLKAAIDAVLQAKKPSPAQKPSIGCNIKWKALATPANPSVSVARLAP
jgi:peroxiredoxin